ncbi:hypothetical protein BH23PLA1_BH23PLA1_22300 [soil metagenome]
MNTLMDRSKNLLFFWSKDRSTARFQGRGRSPRRFASRPVLEGLEAREAPSTFGLLATGMVVSTSTSISITITNEDDSEPEFEAPLPSDPPENEFEEPGCDDCMPEDSDQLDDDVDNFGTGPSHPVDPAEEEDVEPETDIIGDEVLEDSDEFEDLV